ncbi:MFS transporter [Bythopirellula polymerisocia]|uniref:Major Facilitator Superfamily protein n=1 Tax=Bythopirellula polymerisocia TaxID=2528003 RepID=A0A5C6CXY7_9BACT|nr:MFS transporter [Bythopirellula polymerisocia]TWU28351.1 Major Facilitator Superfamily protein [Bythopirellula polymerisocia]
MNKLRNEFLHFLSYPHNMRILLLTNLIYAFVLPVIDIFVGAYVMRNTQDVKMVVIYQLAVYTGIPFTFLVNGFLLQHISIKRLYSAGMLLSGISMAVMMSLGKLSMTGVGVAGLMMGMSFGLFWANRDFLALSTTNDSNRNYYYGLETFFYTNTYVVVPVFIGWFIEGTGLWGWFGGDRVIAYQIVTAMVFLLTIVSSILIHQGRFENPPKSDFIYFRFHWLWNQMQVLAILKGLAQGYIVTAPAMLVMLLVGQEGALGTIQAIGGILSAFLLYFIGRTTKPKHRIIIFTVGLGLFALGGLANALLFNATGVLLFMVCLLLGRPLHDIAYFPIQMQVIDTVSAIEHRNKFAYIFNQEFGFFIGRFTGCGLFILLANNISDTFALRYALLIIGIVQLLSIWVANRVLRGCRESAPSKEAPVQQSSDMILEKQVPGLG